MLQENLILTLLIPCPKQPGNDIDVYLEPLIEELNELWNNGVNMYDKISKSMFNLKAILMWTISDFPAYGNLAGCTTKGKLACPICGFDTCSYWLPHSRKFAYMGHRRFLDPSHSYRFLSKCFDGDKETKEKPKSLTGAEIFLEIKGFVNDWGKKGKIKRKRKRDSKEMKQIWKKKSIFFDLPYWEVCHFNRYLIKLFYLYFNNAYCKYLFK